MAHKPAGSVYVFYLSNNTASDMELLRFIDQNRCRDVTISAMDTIDVLAQVLDVFFYVSMVLCVFAGLLLPTSFHQSRTRKRR